MVTGPVWRHDGGYLPHQCHIPAARLQGAPKRVPVVQVGNRPGSQQRSTHIMVTAHRRQLSRGADARWQMGTWMFRCRLYDLVWVRAGCVWRRNTCRQTSIIQTTPHNRHHLITMVRVALCMTQRAAHQHTPDSESLIPRDSWPILI